MWNVTFNDKTLVLKFVYSNKDKLTNKTKMLLKLFKSLIFLLGGETANHVNFMQPILVSYSTCYFSPLEGGIAEWSKILTSGN